MPTTFLSLLLQADPNLAGAVIIKQAAKVCLAGTLSGLCEIYAFWCREGGGPKAMHFRERYKLRERKRRSGNCAVVL